MSELKVGDTIWRFDGSRRIYNDKNAGPIYREHWVETVIQGETSRSWLVGMFRTYKVPKKGPHPGWAFSQKEVDDDCWVRCNRYKIEKSVAMVSNADVLRKVAELIGWKEGDERN